MLPPVTRADRIRKLNEKLDQMRERNRLAENRLKARRRKLEAAERARERRLDTRRKILAGAWVLREAGRSGAAAAKLRSGLDGFLDKPRDRELFDLPPKDGAGA